MKPSTSFPPLGDVVPLLVFDDARYAKDVGSLLVDAGIVAAEVAMRTPAALDAMEMLSSFPELVLVAGTVLQDVQLTQAIRSGAAVIVSPGFDARIAALCAEAGVPLIPGAATATEILTAKNAGFRAVKFFPAQALGGVDALRSLADAISGVQFLASGGITTANVDSYLAEPSVFAVSGSWLTSRAALNEGDLTAIRDALVTLRQPREYV